MVNCTLHFTTTEVMHSLVPKNKAIFLSQSKSEHVCPPPYNDASEFKAPKKIFRQNHYKELAAPSSSF